MEILHSADNPRNSEGSFLVLKNGNILFAYTRYFGNSKGWDHDHADIAAIESSDGGKTWSATFRILVKNTAQNVMSVSLNRLRNGRIMMLYLQKTFTGDLIECRAFVRFSDDESKTWSEARPVTEPGLYHVVNNDRVVQLSGGRILVPFADHGICFNGRISRGITKFAVSDDDGNSWRTVFGYILPAEISSGCQEPGVIELADGTLYSWSRNNGPCQYKSFSQDRGETWSEAVPAPEFPSFCSPLSMKRDPVSGKFAAIWCYLSEQPQIPWIPWATRNRFVIAFSSDEGKSWTTPRVLANVPEHGYCYTAMLFHDNELHLGYCSGIGKDLLCDLTLAKYPMKYFSV